MTSRLTSDLFSISPGHNQSIFFSPPCTVHGGPELNSDHGIRVQEIGTPSSMYHELPPMTFHVLWPP